jgi:ATP-dependent Lon protease
MHPDSADASTLQTYIEWVLEMPFGKKSAHKLDIVAVEKRLSKDHFGLEKAKERIVEFFAVKELLEQRNIRQKEAKGAILCFIGPPGVGKTSLANSIATALKRELVRIALGGLEDVNELRGHRRTYVGAMPGRIVQGLISAKQSNPVVVLDEIDKVGRSHRGDPTAVLLEILDPEQNEKFRDYYLNFNIDLSDVLFIATANEMGSIPAPLRDRMEFIQVSSYTPDEKFQIAKKYLIPQELEKHGLKSSELAIGDAAINEVIQSYTREAGVRNLRRRIATLMRKTALLLLTKPETKKISVTLKNLSDFMDKKVFEIDPIDKLDRVGVVNGLAWTSVGGDVLKIEAMKIRGKGALQLTGSLGDVMKESARIAHSVVKNLVDTSALKMETIELPKGKKGEEVVAVAPYNHYDLHIHVPEGATPKDGPSAGIAMCSVIASILTNRAIRNDVAMTGDVTLTGVVLPIGGLKEKLIAAQKAKIKTALIPKKNFERDMDDLPQSVKDDLTIIPVTRIEEVLKYTLHEEKNK